MDFPSGEVEVLFEIVSEGRHHHVFVGLGHPPAVDPAHVHKVDQRTQYRLYRPASDLADPLGIGRISGQFSVHAVIVGLVDTFFLLRLREIPFSLVFDVDFTLQV